MKHSIQLIFFAAIFVLQANAVAEDDPILLTAQGHKIEFLSEKVTEADSFTLKIASPDGRVWQRDYNDFHLPEIDLRSAFDGNLPDGQYHYEILPHSAPVFGTVAPELRGLEPSAGLVPSADSGTFTIHSGQVLDPNLLEAPAKSLAASTKSTSGLASDSDEGTRDQVINDDLIVIGSECVGFDCVNGEVFGFDTIRMKENNTRLQFMDTSSAGGFPNRNWQIRANDSTNGGSNYLAFVDQGPNGSSEDGTITFRVTGGAPANSLFVASTGRVGFRTASPVLDLHVNTSNTPGLRLEQNSSGGFSAQTWDIAGNEANFFIRDVTSGSRLPFRIRPGAPTSSIDINAAGNIGIGTASPSASLHVLRSDNSTQVRIEDTGITPSFQNLLVLKNNGNPQLRMENSDADLVWNFRIDQSDCGPAADCFFINRSSGPRFRFLNNGDIRIDGNYTQGSSRTIKERIIEMNAESVLAKLDALAVHEWSYRKDPSSRHVGPMAEDFYAIFELGDSEKHIAPGDLAGVALAVAKALHEQSRELEEKNASLEARLERLEALLLGRH